MVSHEERAHALLSASGSERWINCPASPRLEEDLPEETSVYAREGTLAHELAEIMLKVDLKKMTMAKYREELEVLKKHELYSDDLLDPIMDYVNYVKQQFAEAKRIDPAAMILIETRFDLRDYVEMGFGTSDAAIVYAPLLEVIDLKFGAGKEVKAENNTQLMYYALGVLVSLSAMANRIETVKLTIVQPRMSNIDSWEISKADLLKWAEEVLKPKAIEAYRGDGPQVPGDWCQFCKVRPRCKALHDLAMENVRRDFEEQDDPRLINDDELLTLYQNADFISKFLTDVKATVLKEALAGKKWEGYKLVEGKSNRQITDEAQALLILKGELYTTDEIANVKIKGLGDLEKLLKKAGFNSLLGHLVVKPAGTPTLVDENDKRELYGVSRTAQDFAEIEDDLN
jgi:hypothetical protein